MRLAKWDVVSVELDVLPLDVLRRHIAAEIESRMDLNAPCRVRECEHAERHQLSQPTRMPNLIVG